MKFETKFNIKDVIYFREGKWISSAKCKTCNHPQGGSMKTVVVEGVIVSIHVSVNRESDVLIHYDVAEEPDKHGHTHFFGEEEIFATKKEAEQSIYPRGDLP